MSLRMHMHILFENYVCSYMFILNSKSSIRFHSIMCISTTWNRDHGSLKLVMLVECRWIFLNLWTNFDPFIWYVGMHMDMTWSQDFKTILLEFLSSQFQVHTFACKILCMIMIHMVDEKMLCSKIDVELLPICKDEVWLLVVDTIQNVALPYYCCCRAVFTKYQIVMQFKVCAIWLEMFLKSKNAELWSM